AAGSRSAGNRQQNRRMGCIRHNQGGQFQGRSGANVLNTSINSIKEYQYSFLRIARIKNGFYYSD
ncbi:hypothetical protein, partial [Pseudomonas syringae group genomosp. 3]|uniref:hypothetical protein n=1 Tax=Pseudomonas syringae group genomosp. 3 TaxID=251701 RepID=UPI001E3CB08A